MHYEAHLFRDCRKIDSSRDKGEPYKFKVGDGTTIKGWERGLLGMCVGDSGIPVEFVKRLKESVKYHT